MGTRLVLLALLAAASFCCLNAAESSQTQKSVFASGKSECLDCAEKNVQTELAYEGLQVAINCKSSNGGYEIKGTGNLDKNGEYKIQLPAELIGDDGELKQDCFAQLHSPVSNTPCPDENGLNPAKLVLESKKDGAHALSTAAKLPFSSATCASAFLFWHKLPHKKYIPPYKYPPKPYYHKKPLPSVPITKPPPSVPTKKWLPAPIYKKPCPPWYKKPMPHWPPIYKKPFPHFPKHPPMDEKPSHP